MTEFSQSRDLTEPAAADSAAAGAGDVAPAPRTCAAAVVFSEPSAAGCFEDLLQRAAITKGAEVRIAEGDLDGRRVAVQVTPHEADQVASALDALLDGHRPRLVFLAGFATALSADLQQGDLLLPTELVDEGGDVIWNQSNNPLASVEELAAHRGRTIALGEVPRTPQHKSAAAARYNVVAAMRMPQALVAACTARRVPCLVLAVISEAADEETPADVDFAAAQPTRAARFGAVLGALFRRPGSVKDFYRRKERQLVLGDQLAAALRTLIGAQPAEER